MPNDIFNWPQHWVKAHYDPQREIHVKAGYEDDLTAFNEQLQINMCRQCWDGCHSRDPKGCTNAGCECKCYHGSSRGLKRVRPPAKGYKEQTNISDLGVGTIEIG